VHPPYLSFVAQPVLPHQLQLVIDSLLLEGPPWRVVGRGVYVEGDLQFL
jgi:hypothetical protein